MIYTNFGCNLGQNGFTGMTPKVSDAIALVSQHQQLYSCSPAACSYTAVWYLHSKPSGRCFWKTSLTALILLRYSSRRCWTWAASRFSSRAELTNPDMTLFSAPPLDKTPQFFSWFRTLGPVMRGIHSYNNVPKTGHPKFIFVDFNAYIERFL